MCAEFDAARPPQTGEHDMTAKTKSAASAKTADATFESFTAGNQAMKEGFEKAVSAFGDFNSFSKENVEAVVESFTTAGKGIEAINANVASYTKAQMEGGVAAAKKLASVKSVQELFEVQTDYAKSAMDAYIGEMNKAADLYAKAVKDAVKPLNKRVSATVELFQAQR
jgi:phasin family protein